MNAAAPLNAFVPRRFGVKDILFLQIVAEVPAVDSDGHSTENSRTLYSAFSKMRIRMSAFDQPEESRSMMVSRSSSNCSVRGDGGVDDTQSSSSLFEQVFSSDETFVSIFQK